jgi:hypothetical protein
MATARDRHYDTRSARLVTSLGVVAALPQPCNNMTLTHVSLVAFVSQIVDVFAISSQPYADGGVCQNLYIMPSRWI